MEETLKPRKKKMRRRPFGRCYRRVDTGAWIVQFPDPTGRRSPSGRTAYVTRTVATKTEGERLLKEVRRAVLMGKYEPAPEPSTAADKTLLEVMDEYIATLPGAGRSKAGIETYQCARHIISMHRIAGIPVSQVTPADIEAYMAWRKPRRFQSVRKAGCTRHDPNVFERVPGGEVSNATVNRDLSLISAAIGRLVRQGVLDLNPMRRVRKGKERTKTRAVLSKEECGRVLEACDPPLRMLALAALTTGARPCELMAIRWGDVNFDNQTVAITRTKVGNADQIPLHPKLDGALRQLKEERAVNGKRVVAEDEHVFLSRYGKPNWEYRYTWKKATEKAGLAGRPGLCFYSLRHSFATHFLEWGAASDLQMLLGHASLATTERYTRALSGRSRAAIRSISFGS